ncbi:MAG: hypothetical protein LBR25_05765 [Erysipelotrichaceae bacterium]|jgi:hypothetical protein|nr:hypothetical protein [Erysipelotrichaceae bacterium]
MKQMILGIGFTLLGIGAFAVGLRDYRVFAIIFIGLGFCYNAYVLKSKSKSINAEIEAINAEIKESVDEQIAAGDILAAPSQVIVKRHAAYLEGSGFFVDDMELYFNGEPAGKIGYKKEKTFTTRVKKNTVMFLCKDTHQQFVFNIQEGQTGKINILTNGTTVGFAVDDGTPVKESKSYWSWFIIGMLCCAAFGVGVEFLKDEQIVFMLPVLVLGIYLIIGPGIFGKDFTGIFVRKK